MAKLEIGVIVPLVNEPEPEMQKVADLGLRSCQVVSWDPAVWTDRTGERLIAAAEKLGVEITTFWSGYPGPAVWNFIEGPTTIGLVPPEYRQMRVEVLKKAADFAAKLKLASITTHVGFLPENPNDPMYDGAVGAIGQVAGHCADLGIGFWFETGQETPVTLLRTIERVATGNLGINLDPANLILYGKANPIDALDVFGKFVRGVHAKDGLYPTDGDNLGKEVPLGEGKVNFPALAAKLKSLGFAGALTIEREIAGEQQIVDIKKAIELLRPLC
ncbi:MAG: sugar phosphate isomerase/epimerase [Phycisphaerae bacterium]|nr:sugar phosphate isomerase/epimerase [Phycisphaerae bacterium]